MYKGLWLVVLLGVSCGASADGWDLRLGAQTMPFDSSNSNLTAGSSGSTIVFRDSLTDDSASGTLKSFSLQLDFASYVGIVASHGSASNLDVTYLAGGTTFVPSTASISGDTLALELHYPMQDWLDLFGRLNSASYKVTTVSKSPSFSGGFTHGEANDDSTYGSVGLRMKVARHFGLELAYNGFSSVFQPALSLGLYVQF